MKKQIHLILSLSILFLSFQLHAGFSNLAFWNASQTAKLYISTTAQTIKVGLCSSIVTVQTKDKTGAVANVTSNLTINLATTGSLTFYSDSACSTAITSVVVATGTSSKSFYFIKSAVTTETMTLTAAAYKTTTQAAVGATNPFIWTGSGGDANWATGGNWSGGTPPGTLDVALFNGVCASNCSPTIAANIDVKGLRIATGYLGTITQGAASSLTIGSTGWFQQTGSFVGSSSAASLLLYGDFNLLGGSFISTSGTMSTNGGSFIINNLATFNANNGTFYASSVGGYTVHSIDVGTATLKHVTLSGYCDTYNFNNSTIAVTGNLTFAGGVCGEYFYAGTFDVSGNLSATGVSNNGTININLIGNPSGQTVSADSTAFIHNLNIVAGVNNVTFSGDLSFFGTYTLTSVGTLTTTGTNLTFLGYGYISATIKPGTAIYNNVKFRGYNSSFDFDNSTMNISGNLTIGGGTGNGNDGGYFYNGTLNVGGNATVDASSFISGSAVVRLTGNASGQLVSTPSNLAFPNLEIAAGTHDVTFGSVVGVSNNYIVTSVNTLTTTNSTLKLYGNNNSSSIQPGTAVYNNVIIHDTYAGATYNLNASTFNIAGNLTLASTVYPLVINSGTLSVKGNLSSSGNSISGTAATTFTGASDQTVTSSGGSLFPAGNITVNTSGGAKLLLGSDVSFNNIGQTLSVTSGAIDMANHNLTVKALSLNGNTLTKNSGVLIVNGSATGSGSLFGGTVAP